jgi:polyhydroxybutyrate depolymerase
MTSGGAPTSMVIEGRSRAQLLYPGSRVVSWLTPKVAGSKHLEEIMVKSIALLIALAAATLSACAQSPRPAAVSLPVAQRCAAGNLPSGRSDTTFAVAGWPDRDYDLELPDSYRCGEPIGLVVVYHGGGGNKENMRRIACPGGDLASPHCLDRAALAAGMAVVFPNGTNARGGKPINRGGLRTWNSGGGRHGYICVSGSACNGGVDDIAYTRALLAQLGRRIDIDARRVFATGFSDGAAFSQRLACEASETFAAIAPVAGENQFAINGCTPVARVAVLDIHGTLDKCWPYDGGPGGCIESGLYVSVADTLAGWAARNGCDAAPTSTPLPPRPGVNDGTSVVRLDYAHCGAGGALQHLEVIGNGHYWPDGERYANPRLLGGTMSRQLDTGAAIVAFFAAHGRP